MRNRNIMILNVQAKDVMDGGYIVDKKSKKDIHKLCEEEKRIFSKYKGSMDYSLLTMYLQENHKKFIKVNKKKQRYYSNDMITVNFDYSVTEEYKNKKGKTKKKVITSTKELREKLYKDGFTLNVNGVDTKYVRLYRSSGSARNGKVNFVNEKYYEDILKYCMAGIEYKNKNDLDLPSIEAYISLIATSIIDTFQMSPKNVLLIDDIESTFPDTVMATELIKKKYDEKGNVKRGELHTYVAEKEITNKLTDGEALLSKEIFEENCYGDKATIQLRNRFYKGIGINTDIQQFFEDNGITNVSQLNGKTLAKDIKDIKLITTKSSIKYLKKEFNKTFEEWCDIALDTWGICKTDKGQHHNFNNMAFTHYQLLNTLGMSYKEMEQFLQPTKEYIKLLKNDVSVFKLYLGLIKDGTLKEILEECEEDTTELEDFTSNSEFVLNMLKINEDFINTKICKKFREEIINNYKKNVKKGHVLINGTYATVINNPYEYLLASIGQYKGLSKTLHKRECYCKKYNNGDDILAVRSPQPTMSNVTTMINNTECKEFDEYFNPTDNVIFISSIGWNIMELESSMDFDGDCCLITNDRLLTRKYRKLDEDIAIDGKTIKRFLVSTDFTWKSPIPRSYTPKDLANTDINCAEGKIGEVINLVQMLNSVYWDKKYKGEKLIKKGLLTRGKLEKELFELYRDISNLNILSCIVIDSAKKSSPVDVTKELDRIRAKGYLGRDTIRVYNKDTRKWEDKEVGIRPFFFKFLDGGKDYKFNKYDTGMDYLIRIMNKGDDRKDANDTTINLKDCLIKQKMNEADRKKIQKFTNLVAREQYEISNVYKNDKLEVKEEYRQVQDIKADFKEKFDKITLNKVTIYTIIKRLSKAIKILDNNRKILKKQKKDLRKVKRFHEIEELKKQFNEDNESNIKFVRIGRGVLRHLYELDSVLFLSCFRVKANTSTIYRSDNGDIHIYEVKYKKLG
ncbi:hypothetical protein [Clostridium botulinum]|uniref:RNA-dependent RNA polymerase n=1 Tax=Clostridium botulinum (strain Kyoto / Type A2) TaxID=536232 RepID=C1FP83_CLOBJ|nr:hypothetical protein [Clostridium botulinum]ACO85809.1 conserved hypothetical protein [Clostridium botulinum A2 str. Kyoto]AUN07025.1 hypothetical protein RSJ14_10025 [Clostridium botulinum]MBN3364722.1 hypothetical protein [Clostridium botulinum]MBN3373729.1 hypothetical protein [Clostridium botulinum]MBN3385478.1 hypothetical protein [Clostridium botulinum]